MSVYLGPSAAGRWLLCTASPGFIDKNQDRLPPQKSWAADEGVEAHDHGGHALEVGGFYDYDSISNMEMRRHVKNYVDLVLSRFKARSQLIVETKYPLFYMAGRNGIVDAAIVSDELIEIIDLKYGQGVSVEAENNPQIAIYAMNLIAALRKEGRTFRADQKLKLTIYQPRCREGEPIREWHLTLAELDAFCEKISKTAANILLNPYGGKFFPSEKTCRFCDAKSICGAYAQLMLGELPADTPVEAIVPAAQPSTLAFPAPESLTLEQVTKIIGIKSDLVGWLEDVQKYAKSLLDSGKEVPGFKLVAGTKHRQWKDEDEAARLLRRELEKDEVYVKKLISPAQAETLLKGKELSTRFKNLLQAQIEKPEGNPVMVTADDPRPPVNAASVFTDITAEEVNEELI